jgi:hypothetical protein
MIAVSPESGNERVRYRNKTFAYSNEELMRAISAAEKLRIKTDIFFAMGSRRKASDLSVSALCEETSREGSKHRKDLVFSYLSGTCFPMAPPSGGVRDRLIETLLF